MGIMYCICVLENLVKGSAVKWLKIILTYMPNQDFSQSAGLGEIDKLGFICEMLWPG